MQHNHHNKIKKMNWDNCEDTRGVEVNDQAASSNGTPTEGGAGYLFHTSTLLGPIVWEWTTMYRRLYIPIQATGNLNDYTTINNVEINQWTPLVLDMDIQPTDASKVDTRVEYPNLLDYSQQYFTQPQKRDLLRRVSRKLKEGTTTTTENNRIEEVQFVNVLYCKLKRLRINLTEDDHDMGAVDKIRYPAGSKSMVALTFQPHRKRPRLAEEHSFQIHCNQEEKLKHTLQLTDLPRLRLALIDVWLNNKMQNVFPKEMWIGLVGQQVTEIPEANKQYLEAGNYTDFDSGIIPILRRYILKLGIPLSLDKHEGKWSVKWEAGYDIGAKLVLSAPLAEMMGHPHGADKGIPLTSAWTSLIGSKGVDVYGGFRILYLCCDLLEPTMVGNTMAPFLDQFVPHWDESGEAFMEISNTNYIPLVEQVTQLNPLKVVITDSPDRDRAYNQLEVKHRITLSIKTD